MKSSFAPSRRVFLGGVVAGVAFVTLPGCRPLSKPATPTLATQTPSGTAPTPYTDATDALWDVLLPAERDANGTLVSPGAREAGVDTVLAGENVVMVLAALGLVRGISSEVVAVFDDFAGTARPLLNAGLDALASLEHPLARFATLPGDAKVRLVDAALADARLGPVVLAARGVAFLAYLGAVTTDAGLVAVGFPPFEDFANRVAVSGYPRTVAGQVEDYTMNRAPSPTSGDDLSSIMGSDGDLR